MHIVKNRINIADLVMIIMSSETTDKWSRFSEFPQLSLNVNALSVKVSLWTKL